MDWLDDDPESLGATLAMLAAWGRQATDDSADDSLSPSSAKPTSAGSRDAVEPANARRRSVNLSRERQKQELLSLRGQVKAMEKQLVQMKKSRESWLERRCITAAAMDADGVDKGTQLWASVASRQWTARQKAERLNLQLRATLKHQMNVADELKRVILRAGLAREAMASMVLSQASIPRPPRDLTFEQQLLQRLDAISAQWAVPFSRCRRFHESEPLTPRFLEMHLSRDGTNEKALDVCSSSVYPFDADDVADALWSFFATEFRSEDDYSWATATQNWKANDVHVSSFHATTNRDGRVGMLRGQCARKRFVNSDGHTVIATAICAVPVQSCDDSEETGFVLREESWVRFVDVGERVAQRDGQNQRHSTTPLSVIQHVRRTRVQATTNRTAKTFDIEELTEMLKRLIVEELAIGEVGIEEMLMHKPAKRSKKDSAPQPSIPSARDAHNHYRQGDGVPEAHGYSGERFGNGDTLSEVWVRL